MPVSALWALVISLIGLALGLTYKWVENAHALKLADKEADRLRTALTALEETRKNETLGAGAQMDALKKAHNKEISDIKELHQRTVEELKTNISELSNKTHKESASEVKYLTTGPYKWKVTVHKNGNFTLDEYPICAEHDLKFIFGSQSKYCPNNGCRNLLNDYDAFKVEQTVKSLIERNVRNNDWSET